MYKLALFLTFSLVASLSNAIVSDFCVGDLNLPMGPVGYACKNPSNVTVDDFIYTGFRVGGPTTNIFKNNVNLASANAYPGLNGFGISMARLDFGVGGVMPMHTHRTSEVLIVATGKIMAGFIDRNNVAYYKTLQVGDVMICPQGLLHFQINVGRTSALPFISLHNANPRIQFMDPPLFASNLPTELIEKTTLFDHDQVMKLKMAFGSS